MCNKQTPTVNVGTPGHCDWGKEGAQEKDVDRYRECLEWMLHNKESYPGEYLDKIREVLK